MRVLIVLCLLIPFGNLKSKSPEDALASRPSSPPKSIYDLMPGGKNSPLSAQNGEASQITVPMPETGVFSTFVREVSVSPSVLENRAELTDLIKSTVKTIMKEDPALPTINPDVHSPEELQNAKQSLPPEVAKDPNVGAIVSLMMTTGKKSATKVVKSKKVQKATKNAIHDATDAHIKKAVEKKVDEEQNKIPKNTKDLNKVKESMKKVCLEAASAGEKAENDPEILKSAENEIKKVAEEAIERASSDSVDGMLAEVGFVKMTLFELLKPKEGGKAATEPAKVSKIRDLEGENTVNLDDDYLV